MIPFDKVVRHFYRFIFRLRECHAFSAIKPCKLRLHGIPFRLHPGNLAFEHGKAQHHVVILQLVSFPAVQPLFLSGSNPLGMFQPYGKFFKQGIVVNQVETILFGFEQDVHPVGFILPFHQLILLSGDLAFQPGNSRYVETL